MKKLFYAALATALCVTTSAQPVIRNIVPTTGTAGFGQLITIQGFGLNAANNPVVNFQPQAGGATLHCSFNMPVKYQRVQVLKIKTIFSAKDHPLKQTNIKPLGYIHAQVVAGCIFTVKQSIT